MADVAAAAGVSHQTVSRVLNDHAHVRPDTRDRVMAAIETLGYRRNQAARTLVTARSATIGVMTTATTHVGPSSTVLAIEEAARAQGYFVSLGSLQAHDAASARAILEQFMDQGVDGVIVVAPIVDVARLIDDVDLPIPIVVVAARGDAPPATDVRYVHVDQRGGAARATEHLLSLGHEKIVHLEGADGWYDAIERAAGFREAMSTAGRTAVSLPAHGWGAHNGHAIGSAVIDEVRSGATAIFAANDYLALGVTRALWESDIRVPDDVSVVGFDDIDGSGFFLPPLTTVSQPFRALGEAAVHGLLSPGDAQSTPIAAELIVRGSSAPRI